MKPAQRLQQTLDYQFFKFELLQQALTHRSHSSPHNERLEYLGDSVLDCAVAKLLYDRFPDQKEGELSRLRASLVRQETLAEVANELELGKALRLGEGELKSGGASRPSILADAMEAVIGAIFLDGGFETAEMIVERLYRGRFERLDPRRSGKDAKTCLQEWLQARQLPVPKYALQKVEGEGHRQLFHVTCMVASQDLNEVGSGTSRRSAEQQAASRVMQKLQRS